MDTKTQLLDAAERTVRERGYDGFSYADLAAAVGIRKASIHYHFPTKADLAKALVARYREVNRAFRQEVGATTDDAATRLKRYLAHYRAALGGGDMLCLCVSLAISPDRLSEHAREELNGFHRDSIEWLEAVFEAAQEQGSLAHAADPLTEATGLLALVEGAQLLARAAGEVEHFDRATQHFVARLRTPGR